MKTLTSFATACLLFPHNSAAQEKFEDPMAKWETILTEAEEFSDQSGRQEFLESSACLEAEKAKHQLNGRRERVIRAMKGVYGLLSNNNPAAIDAAAEFGRKAGEAEVAAEYFGFWTALCVEYRRVSSIEQPSP